MTYGDDEETPGSRVRERVYGDVRRDTNRGSRVALASATMAICGFLLIWSVSAYQVTEPARAHSILERGIASVTDIDRYLAEAMPQLREDAEGGRDRIFALPGYPLPVAVTGAELRERNDAELRAIILQRSSAVVYDHGLTAFDDANAQSIPFVSVENVVDSFVALLTGPSHDRAGIAVIVFAGLVSLAVVITAASDRRPGVTRTIGGALLVGALAGLVISIALVFFFGRAGGDDPFTSDMAAIAESLAQVARRNFLIATIFSAMVFVAGVVLTILEKRYFRDLEAAPRPGVWYEPVFIDVPGYSEPNSRYEDVSEDRDDEEEAVIDDEAVDGPWEDEETDRIARQRE